MSLLFQMVEDIIAVCDMVDVRECFAHMRRLLGLAARSVQATLQVQRATKQLLTRFSGTSDPGIRGEVSSTLRALWSCTPGIISACICSASCPAVRWSAPSC